MIQRFSIGVCAIVLVIATIQLRASASAHFDDRSDVSAETVERPRAGFDVGRDRGSESRWGGPGEPTTLGCGIGCPSCTVRPEKGREPSPLAGGSIPPIDGPIVRVAYVIPANRTPQADAVETLQDALRWGHVWFQRQMDRQGFGPLSFRYETESDGITPLIHVVHVDEHDHVLREDVWGATIEAAIGAGVPVWTIGQVWLLVPECHLQLADASIIGGAALGGSFGSGLDPGVAILGSNALPMIRRARLNDDTPYHDHVIPELGTRPLVHGVSFPAFEGTTFSSVGSSHLGACVHELGHAFGLGHDVRNDTNFHGNLMGNGLRGFRGSAYPSLYQEDDARLSYGHALALARSRYFQPEPVTVETVKPILAVPTVGAVEPVDGLLEVHFTASDESGLALALLQRNSLDLVAELELSGTEYTGVFRTAHYSAGQVNQFRVVVYDVHGNRSTVTRNITPQTGHNAAPVAHFRVVPPIARPGDTVLLTAVGSSDPDHSTASLTVEWDLDGDGVHDTAPTTEKTLQIVAGDVGVQWIGLRVTDPAGASSDAPPIPLLVRIPGDLNGDGKVDGADLGILLEAWGYCGTMPNWCVADIAVGGVGLGELGDGIVDGLDLGALLSEFQ